MDIMTDQLDLQIEIKEHACHQMLGLFLVNVAILNAIEIIVKMVLRIINPDEAILISAYETYIAWFRIMVVIVLFVNCMIQMKPYDTHNPNIRKLLVLWGVILIPMQLINDLCAMLYTRMLDTIAAVFLQEGVDKDGRIFALIYDMSHGFKYICIFLAILLGLVMTAEILERRKLMIIPAIAGVTFMLAFMLLRMEPISALGNIQIGVNWTSLIFHGLNTVGLFAIGMYIERLYRKKDQKLTEKAIEQATASQNDEDAKQDTSSSDKKE